MAIHHKAPEQHYTALMAHSGLPYDINPPPHSTDFICKVVGGNKLFPFFVVVAHRVLTDVVAAMRAKPQTRAPPLTLVPHTRADTFTDFLLNLQWQAV